MAPTHTKHRTTQKQIEHQDATDIQKKTDFVFLSLFNFLFIIS